MHRILLAVDGSEHSDRAVRYLIGLIRKTRKTKTRVRVQFSDV